MSKTRKYKLLDIDQVLLDFESKPLPFPEDGVKPSDWKDARLKDVILRFLSNANVLADKLTDEQKMLAFSAGERVGTHDSDEPLRLSQRFYDIIKKCVDCGQVIAVNGQEVPLLNFQLQRRAKIKIDEAENEKVQQNGKDKK